MDQFWKDNSDTILVGVITAIVVLILSEPIKALFRKLGNRLETVVQAFGFAFRKRYYRALAEGHKWLKLIGIYNPSDLHAPRLTEVYISLRLNTAKESPTVLWDHVFDDNQKHMVILGQPGAGKSTLLDYLTLIFTGYTEHPVRLRLGKPVPVFVRLRELRKAGQPQSLLNLIESPSSMGLKKVPAGYFERHLKSGNCIVLLDGLDEVLDEEAHKRVVEEIRAFANEYPDNWIVVTCRIAGWHDQLPGFRQYTVQEFDRDDIRQFIGAWYREVTRTEAINRLGVSPSPEAIRDVEIRAYQASLEQAESLWKALLKNEGLLRIARTPLILSLVTLVHKNRTTDLPKGRARLYRECLEILLDLWDAKDKGLSLPDAPSLNDKLLVLKAIAFHYVENGLLEMDKEGLERLVTPLLPSLTKQVSAASLIRQIYERSGVLVEQAIGRYGFAHRALHDYLAASHVSEQGLDTLLIKFAAEERWREVILIAIGLVKPSKRAEALIQALLQQSGENPASLALAGWSLAEDLQVGEALRFEVKDRLLRELCQTEAADVFSLLTSSLLTSDPEAAQEWMRSVLLGRDPALRRRAMRLLPDLGVEITKSFVPLLIKLLASSDDDTRMLVAMTLPKLDFEPDAEAWRALAKARNEGSHRLKCTATWAFCELGRCEQFGLVCVPAGEFLMGSAGIARDDEKPQHTIYLPTFYIGKTPVTVKDFRSFVETQQYQVEGRPDLNGTPNHPVDYITWKDAMAYAQAQGMTLPSEAEWEKASRGVDGRIYPWGNEWQEGMANTYEYWSRGTRGLWNKVFRRETGNTTPVSYFSPQGDSPYGCADMVGNVWEWTRSLYKPYPYRAEDGREDEGADGPRVLRGGAFNDNDWDARCAYRGRRYPVNPWNRSGFRVGVFVASPVSGS